MLSCSLPFMPLHQPVWAGDAQQLVVSIDIGMAHTTVAYCILEPKVEPELEQISQWPMQTVADVRLPSVLAYDEWGRSKARGAELGGPEHLAAKREGWQVVEGWQGHMCPPSQRPSSLTMAPLRPSVDVVLADFLIYIKDHLRRSFKAKYVEGEHLWTALFSGLHLVMPIPTGWDVEHRIRYAAAKSGFVDLQRFHAVETTSVIEAALHLVLYQDTVEYNIGTDIVICNYNKTTMSVATFQVMSTKPPRLRGTSPPLCQSTDHLSAAEAFRRHLEIVLEGTDRNDPVVIGRAVRYFESTSIEKFSHESPFAVIDLGDYRSSPDLNIVRGKLHVPKDTVASFFETSLRSVEKYVMSATKTGVGSGAQVVFLGDLVRSPYVREHLQSWAQDHDLSMHTLSDPLAISKGGILAFLNSANIAPFSPEAILQEEIVRLRADLKTAQDSACTLASEKAALNGQKNDVEAELARQIEAMTELRAAVTDATALNAEIQQEVDRLRLRTLAHQEDDTGTRGTIAQDVQKLNRCIVDLITSVLKDVEALDTFPSFTPSAPATTPATGSNPLLRNLYRASPGSELWSAWLEVVLKDSVIRKVHASVFSSPSSMYGPIFVRRLWTQAEKSCDWASFQRWRTVTVAALNGQDVLASQTHDTSHATRILVDVLASAMRVQRNDLKGLEDHIQNRINAIWTLARDLLITMERDLSSVRGHVILSDAAPSSRVVHYGLGLAFETDSRTTVVIVQPRSHIVRVAPASNLNAAASES